MNKIKKEFPELLIEPTTRCNLRCLMCFHSQMKIEPIDMEFSLYEKIIEEASVNKCQEIKFGYRGEPLLHPKIFKMIKLAKKKGILRVVLITNATMLDHDKLRRLLRSGLDELILSIDSHVPFVYDTIRLGAGFYSTFSNVSRLYAMRDLGNFPLKITIQAIKQELNEKEMNDHSFENFWMHYADKITIDSMVDYRNKTHFFSNLEWYCFEPFQRLTILANGDIWLCCGSPIPSKHIEHVNKGILKAWNSPKMNLLRTFHAHGEWYNVHPCNCCQYARMDIERRTFQFKTIKQEVKK